MKFEISVKNHSTPKNAEPGKNTNYTYFHWNKLAFTR